VRLALVLVVATIISFGACKGKAKQTDVTAGCDLSGTYRTRFDAGVGQWLWFRFEVDPSVQHATLKMPSAVDDKATLTIDPDPAACKLSVVAKTPRGELLASITLDPKTQKVTGKLRMVGAREGVVLEGVHDPRTGAPAPKHACIAPGRYQLVIPAEQAWNPLDGGTCDAASIKVPFLVEELGDKLSIDQLDDDGSAAWAAEDYVETGDCSVQIQFRHRDYMTMADLTFGGDKVTAKALSARVSVIESGGDKHSCQIINPMVWVEKLGPS
jgi:hypothetical protein